jgi:hypothetical protein
VEEYARDNELVFKYTSFCNSLNGQWAWKALHMRQNPLLRREGLSITPPVKLRPSLTRSPARSQKRRSSWPPWRLQSILPVPPRQTSADWIGAQVLALEFFGGSRLIVPDQTRSPD